MALRSGEGAAAADVEGLSMFAVKVVRDKRYRAYPSVYSDYPSPDAD